MQSHKTTSAAAAERLSSPSSFHCNASTLQLDNTEIYHVSTDDDESLVHNGQTDNVDDDGFPVLPDFLSGKTFFLYGKLFDRRSVVRYITAYDG